MSDDRLRSIDNGAIWDAAENELESAQFRICKALDDLLSVADRLLDDNDIDYSVQVYTEIAHFLATGYRSDNLWFWLRRRIAQLSEDSKEAGALCIACFEPWTESPVYTRDIELLFGLLEDPKTDWMLFLAYENEEFPENIRRHYDLLIQCGIDGITPRPIFEDRLQSYLARSKERTDNK